MGEVAGASNRTRFALLGAGMIGQTHAVLINSLPDRAVLAAVVDTDPARAGSVAVTCGVDVLPSIAETWSRTDIDAVSICLPSGMHADVAIAAMQAGKHVVIEKPIDVTLEAADRIIKAEHDAGVVATVVSQRRFQTAPALMHEAIAAGRLGRISAGVALSPFWRTQDYYQAGPWRGTRDLGGGGALMNQGIHALDLLVWMLGEPVEVQAYAGLFAHEGIEVEDTTAAVIRFASGAIGSVVATTAAYPGLPVRLSVHGDGGSAVFDEERLAFLRVRDTDGDLVPAADDRTLDDALRDQYVDFLDAIGSGRPPAITTEDGRRALAVVLAIYESARTGTCVRVG